jgi:hypothetical protein
VLDGLLRDGGLSSVYCILDFLRESLGVIMYIAVFYLKKLGFLSSMLNFLDIGLLDLLENPKMLKTDPH